MERETRRKREKRSRHVVLRNQMQIYYYVINIAYKQEQLLHRPWFCLDFIIMLKFKKKLYTQTLLWHLFIYSSIILNSFIMQLHPVMCINPSIQHLYCASFKLRFVSSPRCGSSSLCIGNTESAPGRLWGLIAVF